MYMLTHVCRQLVIPQEVGELQVVVRSGGVGQVRDGQTDR